MITADLLRRIMPQARERADVAAEHLEAARARWVSNDPTEVAHWLGQLAHESGELRYLREIASGEAYEGRRDLGNTQTGDGKRFRGRGYIQLTGRANYAAYAADSGLDAEGTPELLEEPQHAADVSGWFWRRNRVWSRTAETEDRVLAVTRIINGGTNGLESRRRYTAAALRELGNIPAAPIFRPDAEPPAPIENRTEPPADIPMPRNPLPDEITGGQSMIDPISLAATLIPLAAKYLPEVAKIFGPRSEVSQRNVAIATKTLEVISEATGSVNAQQALEKVATDPAARKAAREALVVLYDIVPVGRDGVDGARTFVAGQVSSGDLASRMVWGALVLVLAIVVVAGGGWVLREVLMGADTTPETRAQITGYYQNAGLIVLGFVFGSSVSSRRKDEKSGAA